LRKLFDRLVCTSNQDKSFFSAPCNARCVSICAFVPVKQVN
jgi:hypothetical protein